ncbi:MAG: type IV pilus modification PilV family protein [Verrucomicrobiota bacterium]
MKTFNITKHSLRSGGFSLIEVVLAIGIFLVTILALVGLLGPTLKSVDEVEKTEEVVSVVNSVNAFLQNSLEIADTGSKFDAIYNAVGTDGHAQIYVFRAYREDSTDVELQIGFDADEEGVVGDDAIIDSALFENVAGPIYRVVLTPSSVIPEDFRFDNGPNAYPRYSLTEALEDYPEGYFAMEARIFAREADMAAALPNGSMPNPTLDELVIEEPMFIYNTAVVR